MAKSREGSVPAFNLWRSFGGSIAISIFGLAAAFWLGFREGNMEAGLSTLFLCFVLSVLEVSLSFDNAVVNASVLERMSEIWRRRFLTWGILIAVFGMRLVLPLFLVAVMASIGPIDALMLAIREPKEYAALMLSIHTSVAAFGGAFLFMVGLEYFLDEEKEEHWLKWLEGPLSRLGRVKSIEVIFGLGLILGLATQIKDTERMSFLISGVAGIITFLLVDALSAYLESSPEGAGDMKQDIHRASVGLFLYLEILDASFSFDGVVGAFALTHSLFLIAIGLGIGAMFVRSITIVLVEKKTLAQFRYLEHGAFWAILSLAGLMFAGVFHHIPEVVTGLCGAAFIGASVWASIRTDRKRSRAKAA